MGIAHNGTALSSSALAGLTQPLHLFEYVTRSQHYHFGYFPTSETSLGEAMDHMARRGAERFEEGARVLDVGCALGGTSRLLAARGAEVVGIDPCPDAIEYARSRPGSAGIRFHCADFDAYTRLHRGDTFDGIVLIEVLQYFSSLESFFAACRGLLRPGGLVVVDDVFKAPELRLDWVPYHRRGTFLRAVTAEGLEVVESEDISARIAPTLPHFSAELADRRAEIAAFFSTEQRAVERELDELLAQVALLRQGFEERAIAYETTVLRVRR